MDVLWCHESIDLEMIPYKARSLRALVVEHFLQRVRRSGRMECDEVLVLNKVLHNKEREDFWMKVFTSKDSNWRHGPTFVTQKRKPLGRRPYVKWPKTQKSILQKLKIPQVVVYRSDYDYFLLERIEA
ncbi:hypothetical protein CalGV056 [Clostera anastomosis granulovirus A]|uniref:Uncharacterized protein n=1 Tax=Clostera anastomosis granulovirus A TaxID=1986289 RepID=U5KBU4_9BBAC|nr:hypothetical protein CalGV056 [Clostera anastomosis granulovirus Henan]AGQ20314.1 hypothetical protein CalGV056 [Clostera anastomosis granulovirus Henan]